MGGLLDISGLFDAPFAKQMAELQEHMKKSFDTVIGPVTAIEGAVTKAEADLLAKVISSPLVPPDKIYLMNSGYSFPSGGGLIDVTKIGDGVIDVTNKYQHGVLDPPPYDVHDLKLAFQVLGGVLKDIAYSIYGDHYRIEVTGCTPDEAGDLFSYGLSLHKDFTHDLVQTVVRDKLLEYAKGVMTVIPQSQYLSDKLDCCTGVQRKHLRKVQTDWSEEYINYETYFLKDQPLSVTSIVAQESVAALHGFNWATKLKFHGLRSEWDTIEVWRNDALLQLRGRLLLPTFLPFGPKVAWKKTIVETVHTGSLTVDEFYTLAVYLLNDRAVDLIRGHALR